MAKIKGALGKAKVKQFLISRFKTITPFIQELPKLIERDAVFEREISEAGEKANMLKTDFMREKIKDGLENLGLKAGFQKRSIKLS